MWFSNLVSHSQPQDREDKKSPRDRSIENIKTGQKLVSWGRGDIGQKHEIMYLQPILDGNLTLVDPIRSRARSELFNRDFLIATIREIRTYHSHGSAVFCALDRASSVFIRRALPILIAIVFRT